MHSSYLLSDPQLNSAPMTKILQTGQLTGYFFLTDSYYFFTWNAWKFKNKAPVHSVLGEASLPGLKIATFLLYHHRTITNIPSSSFNKGTNTLVDFTTRTSPEPHCLPKAPPPATHTLGIGASALIGHDQTLTKCQLNPVETPFTLTKCSHHHYN